MVGYAWIERLDAPQLRGHANPPYEFAPVSAVRSAQLNGYAAVAAGSGSSVGCDTVSCRNRRSNSAAGTGGEK
jgi:hypothetical protein